MRPPASEGNGASVVYGRVARRRARSCCSTGTSTTTTSTRTRTRRATSSGRRTRATGRSSTSSSRRTRSPHSSVTASTALAQRRELERRLRRLGYAPDRRTWRPGRTRTTSRPECIRSSAVHPAAGDRLPPGGADLPLPVDYAFDGGEVAGPREAGRHLHARPARSRTGTRAGSRSRASGASSSTSMPRLPIGTVLFGIFAARALRITPCGSIRSARSPAGLMG